MKSPFVGLWTGVANLRGGVPLYR